MKPFSSIAGIILSAGASSRMGSPKALLEFGDGATLLSRQAALLKDAGCNKTVVVVGSDSKKIRSKHPDLDVEWVENAQWQKGQFSSLQAGISQILSTDAEGTLVLPVDCEGVSVEVVQTVIETALRNPHLNAIIPEYDAKGGHPVYMSINFCRIIASLDPEDKDARLDRQMGLAKDVLRLPVNDANVVRNINDQEDWIRLCKS
ncbi:MAG: nucleotidyltransferase family protein [Pseudomonadota bacterium]